MVLDEQRQMLWLDEQPGFVFFKSSKDFLRKYPIPKKPNTACVIHGESKPDLMTFQYAYNNAWKRVQVYHVESNKMTCHTFDLTAI